MAGLGGSGKRRRAFNQRRRNTMNFNKELDARGLSCPLPIVKTKKSLNDMTPGQVLKVLATDVGSVKDMEAFAKQTGNPLVETTKDGDSFVFFLRKG
jgi:tRNA 2-thiouridine synthesizing protein A